nr:MAG TPA: hypothetical protein [Bacteriophage sp.]
MTINTHLCIIKPVKENQLHSPGQGRNGGINEKRRFAF